MTNPRTEHVDVAACVFEALEAVIAQASEIKSCTYEHAPTDALQFPCIIMQTLGGDPVERRYLDGSCIAVYRFSLQLRLIAEDDQGRLDARALLARIASEVERAEIDLGAGRTPWGVSSDTLPSRIDSTEGHADWKTELTLKYQAHR